MTAIIATIGFFGILALGYFIGFIHHSEPKRPPPTWADLDELQEQIDTIRKHTNAPPRKPTDGGAIRHS